VVKLAKEGNGASTIGTVLRDRYAIPLTKPITGKTIKEILQASGIAPKVPEDLEVLLRKADSTRRYLEKNKSDKMGKRSLTRVESKIYRLVKYYKKAGILPPQWEYKLMAASVI